MTSRFVRGRLWGSVPYALLLSKDSWRWGGDSFGPRFWDGATPLLAGVLGCGREGARSRCRPLLGSLRRGDRCSRRRPGDRGPLLSAHLVECAPERRPAPRAAVGLARQRAGAQRLGGGTNPGVMRRAHRPAQKAAPLQDGRRPSLGSSSTGAPRGNRPARDLRGRGGKRTGTTDSAPSHGAEWALPVHCPRPDRTEGAAATVTAAPDSGRSANRGSGPGARSAGASARREPSPPASVVGRSTPALAPAAVRGRGRPRRELPEEGRRDPRPRRRGRPQAVPTAPPARGPADHPGDPDRVEGPADAASGSAAEGPAPTGQGRSAAPAPGVEASSGPGPGEGGRPGAPNPD